MKTSLIILQFQGLQFVNDSIRSQEDIYGGLAVEN